MTNRSVPMMLAALLIADATSAAQLRLPPVMSGDRVLRAKAMVWLVGPDGRGAADQALAWAGSDLATEGRSVQIESADGVTITLPSQSDLATSGGSQTYYRICYVLPPSGMERCHPLIQLADTDDVQDLLDRVADAVAVTPGSVTDGRLLPAIPDDAAAGWGLALSGTPLAATWSAAGSGGCTTLSCLLDGPGALGTAGQVATVAAGATTWVWATPSAGSESDPVWAASPSHGITSDQVTHWDTAYGWGNHSGLYRLAAGAVAWTDISGAPAAYAPSAHASSHGAAGSDPVAVALSQLAQGGATSGQVLEWSGSAWAPATDDAGSGGGIADAPSDGAYYARRNAAWSAATATGAALWAAADAAACRTACGTQVAGSYLTSESDPTVAGAISTHAAAADPHTGYRLESAAIALGSDVSGTLPVASGGTGQTSLGSVDAGDLGSGSATDGRVLTADGSGGAAFEATPLYWPIVIAADGVDVDADQVRDLRAPEPMAVSRMVCAVVAAPTGSGIGWEMETYSGGTWTSVYSTPPSIAAGNQQTIDSGSTAGTFTSALSFTARQRFRIRPTSVGSTTPGTGATCTLEGSTP